MNTNVDDLMRRTKSYWYEDGLVEILSGLFFLAVALLLLAEWAAPPESPLKWIVAPAFAVVTVVWILVARRVIAWLKERITYPRTGYVAYKQQRKGSAAARAVAGGVIGAGVALALVVSLMYRQDIARLIPLIMGGGVALLLFRIGGEVGVIRLYVLAVWSLLAGAALAWLTSEMSLSIGLYYLLLGLAILLGGALTMIRYLRAAPLEASHD
jgi:hypothetical protein